MFLPLLLPNLYDTRNFVIKPSPDNQVIATTYDFYGGATSSDGTEVTLRSNRRNSTLEKMLLFLPWRNQKVELKWTKTEN